MQADVAETVAKIRSKHRQRMFAMEQRKRANLALGSFLKLMCGWQKDGDEELNKQARDKAAALMEAGDTEHAIAKAREWIAAGGDGRKARSAKKTFDPPDGYREWRDVILASVVAREPFDKIETQTTATIEDLAKTLPVWQWAKDIKGLSPLFVGTIVAEAGDLSNYPKKGHLWKRMGLAVLDGRRQGGLPKSAKAEHWIAHGYNRKRRAKMYVIGDVMVKVGEHYKDVFLQRCAHEYAQVLTEGGEVVSSMDSTIETWAKRGLSVRKVTKAKQTDTMVSAGHLHRRAQRYMEKMVLRDMLREWKAAQLGQLKPADMARCVVPTERPTNTSAGAETPRVAA